MGCTCLGGRTPSSRSHFIVDADWVEYVHDASGVQAFVGQLAGEFGECRVREALREHVVSHAAFDVDFLYVDDGVLVHKPAGQFVQHRVTQRFDALVDAVDLAALLLVADASTGFA